MNEAVNPARRPAWLVVPKVIATVGLTTIMCGVMCGRFSTIMCGVLLQHVTGAIQVSTRIVGPTSGLLLMCHLLRIGLV